MCYKEFTIPRYMYLATFWIKLFSDTVTPRFLPCINQSSNVLSPIPSFSFFKANKNLQLAKHCHLPACLHCFPILLHRA